MEGYYYGEETPKSEEQLTKESIRWYWMLINMGAEMSGSLVYEPFHESEIMGSRKKINPKEYVKKSSETIFRILDLPTGDELNGKVIINIGAGKSELAKRAKRLGAVVMDLDPNYIHTTEDGGWEKVVGSIRPSTMSDPVVGRGETVPVANATADEVILAHILDVVDEPKRLLDEALRIVKPNGKIRIYPVLAFRDLRQINRPGVSVKRIGCDSFTLVIDMAEIKSRKSLEKLLLNKEVLCIKPDKMTWKRRLRGYYYDKEYDLGEGNWWLGDKKV